MLNNGGHYILSKIVRGDETHIGTYVNHLSILKKHGQ